MLKKKKASLTLLFLAVFILFYTLFGIYINIRGSYEFYNRFESVVVEVANYRAQAVDTYLKESFNIIESFHPVANYSSDDFPDIDHQKIRDDQPFGHKKVYKPTEQQYINSLIIADKKAKDMFVTLMQKHIDNGRYDYIPTLSSDNICIQVRPLPKEGNLFNKVDMDFTCTASVDGEEYVFKNKVSVSAQSDPRLRKFVFDPNGTFGDEDDVYSQVVNIVYVGAVIKHEHLLSNLFNAMGTYFPDLSHLSIATKGTYSVAYPQSDRCYGEHCSGGDDGYYKDIER